MTPASSRCVDVLGEPFTSRVLQLTADDEGPVVATLVSRPSPAPSRRAVLYVHGFNDYFFQVTLARFFAERGLDFYAVDLRKYGRSLLAHQTPNMCTSLTDYDEDLDAAAAAVLADGHDELVLMAHSTGGLTVPLWLSRRRNLPVVGLILNSPFFAFSQPAVMRLLGLPVMATLGRYAPLLAVPGGPNGLYGESLHRQFRGEWDYDLAWKPRHSFPVRAGWLRAVVAGQRRLRRGLALEMPSLVLCARDFLRTSRWDPALQRADSVLDPARIAKQVPALGSHATCVRLAGAMHDVVLSAPPARQQAYDEVGRWLDAYL